jgi:hypothetical protein
MEIDILDFILVYSELLKIETEFMKDGLSSINKGANNLYKSF